MGAPTRICFAGVYCAAALAGTALLSPGRAARAEDAVRKTILSNGVRVILKPEKTTETVAVQMVVRTARDTTTGEMAAGELAAHALFYGSLNRSFAGVTASLARMGGSLETLRTADYVAVTCITAPEQLDEALYLLCESLKNADFGPRALERARQEILWGRKRREVDGFALAVHLLLGLGRQPEPDALALRRMTTEQVRLYFAQRYVPSRTVFAVVGRFDWERAVRSFNNLLFDYERHVPPAGLSDSVLPPPGVPRFAAAEAPGSAAYSLVASPAPGVADADYAAVMVLQSLLGAGHASRLFRRIRDAQGIGYEVGAAYPADRGNLLIAYLQWDPRRAVPDRHGTLSARGAVGLLQSQLDALRADPPTTAELERARKIAVGRDALRHERARDRAFLLAWYEAMGAGYALDSELPRRLRGVTLSDLQRVINTRLGARYVVTVSPPKGEPAAAP